MSNLTLKKRRPFWLNVSPLNLPLPGWISFLHRVSGVFLFLGLFWLLALLDTSLQSQEGYERVRASISHPIAKLALLVLLWSYMHHLCAGVRYLMCDLHIGDTLPAARKSAMAVLVVSVLLTVILGALIW